MRLASVFKTGNHNFMNNQFDNNSGNALWIILMAIAMLAFLTGIIARSSSSVNQSGSVEQARIKATSLLRFSQSVNTAVQQMMMNGMSENDLDFLAISGAHNNTNCTATNCEVFHTDGGGIAYQTPAQLMNDTSHTDIWHVSTENLVYQFGCDTADNGCTELLLLAPNIPLNICLQINKIQNITNPSNDAPRMLDILEGSAFTGAYSATVNASSIGGTDVTDEAPQVKGKGAGCVYDVTDDIYYFYQILIPR